MTNPISLENTEANSKPGSKFGSGAALIISAALTMGVASSAHADMMPDGHGPIGVMGEHSHKSGEFMLSYRYALMEMEGNRDGTHGVRTSEILLPAPGSFMVTPIEMRMEKQMLGFMYGVSDKLTLMGMFPYVKKSMSLLTVGDRIFQTKSEGAGDASLTALYTLCDSGDDPRHNLRTQWLLNLGLSFPTGEIDKRDNGMKLPYPMQLGSGTVDPIVGVAYTQSLRDWSWGTQSKTKLRLEGQNDEGYRLGHEVATTAWAAKNLNHNASVSFRFDGKYWGNIHGQDNDLNPNVVPTARKDLRGGRRVDAMFGLNSVFYGHRFAVEFGWPIYQDLDGPQLETDYRFVFGWQKLL